MGLFSDDTDRDRDRLRAAGWTGMPMRGRSKAVAWYWRDPASGAVYREAEALAKLDEAARGDPGRGR